MMTKTKEKKLDKMIERLTTGHLEHAGGYPYDWVRIGDEIVIAELPADNETRIARYYVGDLIAWHDAAIAEMKEYPDTDWASACIDTMPKQIQQD